MLLYSCPVEDLLHFLMFRYFKVKYCYEVFCHLRPGTTLLALYGTLHQLRRMAIYESFCRKSNAVLFATDIAARGLGTICRYFVPKLYGAGQLYSNL